MKLHVVGYGGGANWLVNMGWQLVHTYEDSDCILLTGGADICPSYYNQKKGSRTHCSEGRDKMEYSIFHQAIKDKKYILGICRGLQGIHAYQGFPLIQHLDGHVGGSHPIKTDDESSGFLAPSCHHQNPLIPTDANIKLIGYSDLYSNIYLDGDDKNIDIPYERKEVEILFYPDIKALGVQYHPEWCSKDSDCWKATQKIVNACFAT